MAPKVPPKISGKKASPKTTPKKIDKVPSKSRFRSRRILRAVKGKEIYHLWEQFWAYRALGFVSVTTGVQIIQANGTTRQYQLPDGSLRNANLCGIHALQISLQAVRERKPIS